MHDRNLERFVSYDPQENQRIEAAGSARERARLATSFELVRKSLAEVLNTNPNDIALTRTCANCGLSHGKPRLRGSKIDVSVTHAGDWVAVAIGDGYRVGIDAEKGNYRAWTALEAVTKCDGVGLRANYSGIVVSMDPLQLVRYPSRPALVDRVRLYSLHQAPKGIVATLATESILDPGQ